MEGKYFFPLAQEGKFIFLKVENQFAEYINFTLGYKYEIKVPQIFFCDANT